MVVVEVEEDDRRRVVVVHQRELRVLRELSLTGEARRGTCALGSELSSMSPQE